MSRHPLFLLFILLAFGAVPVALMLNRNRCLRLFGLRHAVDFWKNVFTRHGYGAVILFDPKDQAWTAPY